MYTALVKRNCTNTGNNKDLAYWRDNLFACTLIYLLPFCLIALLPSLYLVYSTGQHSIALVDLLAMTGMLVIVFTPGIRLIVRKAIFVSCIYLFSCAMLYYIGASGPGFVYLLVASLLCIFIFPTTYRFWPAWLNTIICILFGVAIILKLIPLPAAGGEAGIVFLVISANLVFVSFLLAALIPGIFNGLQETIQKEKQLKDELSVQQAYLQQAHHLLEQKNHELEQFAYVASHDLKEPLRMVTSFMGMLKKTYGSQLDDKAHSYIDFAVDGGKRMQRMIDDLLEFSRMARLEGDRELVDTKLIVQEVKQNILKLIEESHADIIIESDLPKVRVHKMDITRLLQNLISNAIRFRKKETTLVIRISVNEKDDAWLFRIEDNGIGIATENTQRIFDIFTRLHSHATYEGTGIGLAVCKKITDRNGGKIWVESKEEEGSVFYFTILKTDK